MAEILPLRRSTSNNLFNKWIIQWTTLYVKQVLPRTCSKDLGLSPPVIEPRSSAKQGERSTTTPPRRFMHIVLNCYQKAIRIDNCENMERNPLFVLGFHQKCHHIILKHRGQWDIPCIYFSSSHRRSGNTQLLQPWAQNCRNLALISLFQ